MGKKKKNGKEASTARINLIAALINLLIALILLYDNELRRGGGHSSPYSIG